MIILNTRSTVIARSLDYVNLKATTKQSCIMYRKKIVASLRPRPCFDVEAPRNDIIARLFYFCQI